MSSSNFGIGKRNTGNGNQEEPTVNPVLAFLVVVALVGALILAAVLAFNIMNHSQIPTMLVAGGLLGNPYRTTRKVSTLYHQRIRHGERSYITFAKLCIIVLALAGLALLLIQMF